MKNGWQTAFYALFTVMQAICLGILLHVVNRLDKLADIQQITTDRVSKLEGRMEHMQAGQLNHSQ